MILFSSSFALSCYSQEELDVSVNSQYWLDLNGKYEFDEIRSISGFAGFRSISPHAYDKYLVFGTYDMQNTKSRIFRNLKNPLINSFHLGGGIYYTNNKNYDDNFELRLTQGLKFFLPSIKEIPLKNYLRFEQRFQKTFDGSSWSTSMRLRYKISTVIEWKKHFFAFNKGMYIPMNVEFFFNLNKADRFNDVIRISPGIGYKFTDEWRAEFYVSYHYTNNTTDQQDGSNDFVFRLRLYKANLVKKPPKLDTKEGDVKELIE